MISTFRKYSEISILNPQIKYFQKNVNYPFFKNGDFGGYDLENWVWTKLALWICPILWIRVKLVYTQLSLTFFIIIGRFGRFINKSKKSYFWKKCKFLNQKSAVEGPKRVLQGHHDSPRSALTFPTNPQIWFFTLFLKKLSPPLRVSKKK